MVGFFYSQLENFKSCYISQSPDCQRHIDDADGMFQALCEHIEFSNNGGNIRPAITVFRQRQPGKRDPRVWNNLMVQYAGYEQEDGSVIGDPASVGLTKFCEKLGWRGRGTQFDFLPMLVSGSDGEPRYYELPQRLCMEVKIKHPAIKEISDLELKWFGLPGLYRSCTFDTVELFLKV